MPGRVGPWGDTQEDGLPGYLLYQVTAPAPAKAQVPFQGMDSPSLEDEISLRSLSLTLRPHRPPSLQHHYRSPAGGHLQE